MNRILFVCSGNYYRSRFAEEVFNYNARDFGSGWYAESRGLVPNTNNVGPISALVLRHLESKGITPINASRHPMQVARSDFECSALIVAMSREEHYPLMRKLFPKYADRIEYWDAEDTGKSPPGETLEKIEILVDLLLERI